jgi:hypothetical protein
MHGLVTGVSTTDLLPGHPTPCFCLECVTEMAIHLTSLPRKCIYARFRVWTCHVCCHHTRKSSVFEADAVVSAPSPLAYSLREECFPELNARLRAEGFGHSSDHQILQSNRFFLCSLEQ